MEVPFLRTGFRMVVFSVIIMVVVLFFRRGLMGDKELPARLRELAAFIRRLAAKIRRPSAGGGKPGAAAGKEAGGDE